MDDEESITRQVRGHLEAAVTGLQLALRDVGDEGADAIGRLRTASRDMLAGLDLLYQIRLDAMDHLILAEVPRLARDAGLSPVEYMSQLVHLPGCEPVMRPAIRRAVEAM